MTGAPSSGLPRRPLIVGNWKMHGTAADLPEIDAIDRAAAAADRADLVLCLPAALLHRAAACLRHGQVGAQDCHPGGPGAHTGQHDAAMLADAGARWVLIGHSECRIAARLTDADVLKRIGACAGTLRVILCVGEERSGTAGATVAVADQLLACLPEQLPEDLVVAYEPVWAIGTGQTPRPQAIARVHSAIRERLCDRFGEAGASVRILYGGSVTQDNATAILSLPHVGGLLVGGASRSLEDFGAIVTLGSAPNERSEVAFISEIKQNASNRSSWSGIVNSTGVPMRPS